MERGRRRAAARRHLREAWAPHPAAGRAVRYLLDSDWIIDYLRGQPAAHTLLRQLRPDGVAVSAVSVGEVYQGIIYGQARAHDEAAMRRFLRGVRVLSVNRDVARQFAITRGFLEAIGQGIGALDTLIAATALHHHLTLVT